MIQVTKHLFSDIPYFSTRDVAYTMLDSRLRKFYKYTPDISSFDQLIKDKQRDKTERSVLVSSLLLQYQTIETTELVLNNINSLNKENTYTVTTAHQPSLATGPLYFIYKIISTINLAETLTKKNPQQHYVPVFYLGSEDHDFEEINHFRLFGKTFTWQSDEKGATGQMSTSKIAPILEQLKEIMGDSENASHLYKILNTAYSKHKTYNEATLYLVNELFKSFGLVILIPNTRALKRLFIPIAKEELTTRVSEKIVNKTINELATIGFKPQAVPRNINLFYLQKGSRNRIVFEEGIYKILNTSLQFTEPQILEELSNYPERFSPNVILRPLYQELILPNLAYIGGGGELAYWLERKAQFEYFDLNFPMLIRRNSVLWIDKGNAKKMNKLGLSISDLMKDEARIIKEFVTNQTSSEISLSSEKKKIENLFNQVLEKAIRLDPSLKQTVLGEKTKQLKGLEQLEGKLLRAEKRKFETTNNQIKTLKSKLFPQNNLQERKDNFIGFYLKYGEKYISTLKEHLHPLDNNFITLIDEN